MKKGKKLMLFAGIGVAVIAVAVVLILVLGGGHRVIKVDDFEGEVTFERNSTEKEIAEGMNLKSEDIITTGEDGLIELLVDSDKHILAQENTSFEIISKGNEKKGKLVIKLNYGTSLVEIENKLNDKSSVEVETPNTSLSVRGTTFEVSYSKENKTTLVEVTDGVVEITCGDETKKVKEGQIATVTDDGAVVVDKFLQYNEVPVFKVGHTEQGRISDVYVKELAEWQYELSEISGTPVDEMVRDGIRIRYWYTTKEEIDENTKYLAGADYLVSNDTYVNDDGDEILTVVSAAEYPTGEVSHTYRYYKEIEDGWYVSLTVFSLDKLEAVGKMDIEDFLPLTNDCYFFFGLPEGVEDSTGTTVEDSEPEEEDEPSVEEDTFDIGDVEPGTTVAEDEVAKLFRDEITYDELIFMIRVLEGARATQRFDIVGTGLNMIWYEPELEGVYSPITGTTYEYDVAMLNRLFGVFTSIRISEDNIPSYATWNGDALNWGTLTMEPCTLEDHGDVTINIYTFDFMEDNQIMIEYDYVRTNDSLGTSGVKGSSRVCFVPDENGKYRYEYSMEYDSSSF